MPEFICTKAWREFVEARTLRKTFERHGLSPISTKQAFFLLCGGVRYVRPNGELLKTHRIVLWINRASLSDEKARNFMLFMLDHLPNDARIDDRSKADILAKVLTCSQALWVAIQTIARLQQRLDVSLLEIVTVAYILLAIIAYSLWFSKPYSIGISDHVPLATEFEFVAAKAGSKTYDRGVLYFDFAFTDMDWNLSFRKGGPLAVLILYPLFAAFAGIHCAAWNYPFPTTVESWMWRVNAIMTGGLPMGTYLAALLMFGMSKDASRWPGNVGSYFVVLCGMLYNLGRLFVVVEVFISLRSAPPGIYQQLKWSNYVGHIGS